MITLYGGPLSGNAYKVRLLLTLLGLEFEETVVNLQTGENRTESFLALNPRGQIPTLVDGDVTVWDSQAILVYLARRYGEAWPAGGAGGDGRGDAMARAGGERAAVRARPRPRGQVLRTRLRPRVEPSLRGTRG